MSNKIVIIDLQQLFGVQKPDSHVTRFLMLKAELEALEKKGLWPEEGISCTDMVKTIADDQNCSYTMIAERRAYLVIGSRENIVNADWAVEGSGQMLSNLLYHVSLPDDYVHPGYMLFFTTEPKFNGLLKN